MNRQHRPPHLSFTRLQFSARLRGLKALRFLVAFLAASLPFVASAAQRKIPKPLPTHPGNIFQAGEEIILTLPSVNTAGSQVMDYQGKIVEEIPIQNGRANPGKLSSGYY